MLCLKASYTRFGETPMFLKVQGQYKTHSLITALDASPSSGPLPEAGCGTSYWFFAMLLLLLEI